MKTIKKLFQFFLASLLSITAITMHLSHAVGPEEQQITTLQHLAAIQLGKNIIEGKEDRKSLKKLPKEMKKYVELFLNNPTSIDYALIDAAKISGNYVKHILSTGISPNFKDDDIGGNTPLHWAARNGITSAVAVLIEADALVDPTNCLGNTPLMLAVKNGHWDIIKYLIAHGANIMIPNKQSKTAFTFALEYNQIAIAKYLMEITDTLYYYWYWFDAAKMGNMEIMQILLNDGLEIDQTDENGYSALHLAVLSEHPDAVKFLIQHKATIENTDFFRRTPLHYAAINDNRNDIIKILLDNKASINALDNNNQTPLIKAAKKGALKNIYTLLQYGANSTQQDNNGQTALDHAQNRNYEEIVAPLKEEQRQ